MNKDNFILYNNMYQAIKCMSDENLGKLMRALFDYNISGIETDDPDIMIAFMFIKNTIDKNNEKWEDIKQKRSEAGKKHTGNQYTRTDGTNGTSVPKMEQNGTNGTVNVNVNDNVNVNVIKKRNMKEKKSYGEFENVNLTDDELNKLKDKYPNDYLERIDRLSSYIASKGARYKSHYATILNWARKDDLIKTRPKTQREKDEEFWAKLDKEIEDEKRRSKEDT